MSRPNTITSMDEIWEQIDGGARQEWEDLAIEAAAADPLVRDMIVRVAFYGAEKRGVEHRKRLNETMAQNYDAVPVSRRSEVYTQAVELMYEEGGLYG